MEQRVAAEDVAVRELLSVFGLLVDGDDPVVVPRVVVGDAQRLELQLVIRVLQLLDELVFGLPLLGLAGVHIALVVELLIHLLHGRVVRREAAARGRVHHQHHLAPKSLQRKLAALTVQHLEIIETHCVYLLIILINYIVHNIIGLVKGVPSRSPEKNTQTTNT